MEPDTPPEESHGVDEVTSLFAQQNLHEIPTELIREVPAEERNEALCDLHAVPEPLPETTSLVSESLDSLDRALQQATDKVAFDAAMQSSPCYVNAWKLRFLRAERFDAERAAERMIRYFGLKKQIFGSDSLSRNLNLDDLSASEWATLESGCLQVAKHRDRGGRAISVEMGTLDHPFPMQILLKLKFFLASLVSDDVEIQKKGMVAIYYAIGRKTVYNERTFPTVDILRALPLRMVGLHACYDNPEFHENSTIAAHSMEARSVVRMRTHFGSHAACQSNLALFGIPLDSIPINLDGSIDCTFHLQWLRQLKEGASAPGANAMDVSSRIKSDEYQVAGSMDVIMGRGQRKHPGNQSLRRFLEQHRAKYEGETWLRKRPLCEDLLDKLKESGTRFVARLEAGGWEEIADDVAVDKIAHMFRDLKRDLRRNNDAS